MVAVLLLRQRKLYRLQANDRPSRRHSCLSLRFAFAKRIYFYRFPKHIVGRDMTRATFQANRMLFIRRAAGSYRRNIFSMLLVCIMLEFNLLVHSEFGPLSYCWPISDARSQPSPQLYGSLKRVIPVEEEWDWNKKTPDTCNQAACSTYT